MTRPNKTSFYAACSRGFARWLGRHDASLVLTMYQWGRAYLVSVQNGEVLIDDHVAPRVMGVAANDRTIWLGAEHSIFRYENCVAPGCRDERGRDARYVPQTVYVTGDVDTHDVTVDDSGRVVFANTKYSCLATVDERTGFVPLWKPPFVSALVPEDRCHLNGVALEDGKAAYVTVIAKTDTHEGWRQHKHDGGCVIDVRTNEVVVDGLSMPHSPRVHNGQLWLLESGSGYLCRFDPTTRRLERVVLCSGYTRGLTFVGDYALVCTSRPRHGIHFAGLEIEQNLAAARAQPKCSLQVVSLKDGKITHELIFEGDVSELYDVAVLPGIKRPSMVGFYGDELLNTYTHGPFGSL